jgi:hypothetical protein
MSEARLWERMRTGISPYLFAQRLENMVGQGVPDTVFHCKKTGNCAFVELKYREKLPSRISTPVFSGQFGLRPEQVSWLHGRSRAGANCWILAQGGQFLFLIPGIFARELSGFNSTILPDRCTLVIPARNTDWQLLATALTTAPCTTPGKILGY